MKIEDINIKIVELLVDEYLNEGWDYTYWERR